MENLNAEEVKRALECCQHSDSEDNYCINCPYYAVNYCAAKISADAIALIMELTEEINAVKVSAIREFAEKLCNYYDHVKGVSPAALVSYTIKQKTEEIIKEIEDGK